MNKKINSILKKIAFVIAVTLSIPFAIIAAILIAGPLLVVLLMIRPSEPPRYK